MSSIPTLDSTLEKPKSTPELSFTISRESKVVASIHQIRACRKEQELIAFKQKISVLVEALDTNSYFKELTVEEIAERSRTGKTQRSGENSSKYYEASKLIYGNSDLDRNLNFDKKHYFQKLVIQFNEANHIHTFK
jgi:hypothetical protein